MDTENRGNKAALWDSMADQFDGFGPQTAENNPVIRLLEEKHLLTPETRVLDIGCAAGQYSFYFARHCKEVVAVDISTQMLKRAEENKKRLNAHNVHFLCRDWEELDLSEIGGPGSFQVVFANMSPAVSGAPGMQKLMEASGGWCWFGGSAGRARRISDQIYLSMGLPLHTQANELRVPRAFEQVWRAGYRPEISYLPSNSEWDMELPGAIAYYENAVAHMRSVRNFPPMTEQEHRDLEAWVRSAAVNGVVHEQIQGAIAVLIWDQSRGKNL